MSLTASQRNDCIQLLTQELEYFGEEPSKEWMRTVGGHLRGFLPETLTLQPADPLPPVTLVRSIHPDSVGVAYASYGWTGRVHTSTHASHHGWAVNRIMLYGYDELLVADDQKTADEPTRTELAAYAEALRTCLTEDPEVSAHVGLMDVLQSLNSWNRILRSRGSQGESGSLNHASFERRRAFALASLLARDPQHRDVLYATARSWQLSAAEFLDAAAAL